MKILVYIKAFRDRDLWPLVDQLCDDGHDVFYRFARSNDADEIQRLAGRTAFDVVITADRALSAHPSTLFIPMRGAPRIFEIILNDLEEVWEHYGRLDLDTSLAKENGWLLVMDMGLCATLCRAGTERVRSFVFGMPRRTVGDAFYYRSPWGIRNQGWQPVRRPIDHIPGQIRQIAAGFGPAQRSIDIIYAGECGYGMDEQVQQQLIGSLSGIMTPSEVRSIVRDFDAALPAIAEHDVATAEHLLDNELLRLAYNRCDNSQQQPAIALFRARLLSQFRSFRRLALVRHLVACFGERFVLIGSHFAKHGLPARVDDFERIQQLYWRSRLALDFGSNSFDCSTHPRVARISACGACVIQREQIDAVPIWGDTVRMRTFTGNSSMIGIIERALREPGTRGQLVRAQIEMAYSSADWSVTLDRALE